MAKGRRRSATDLQRRGPKRAPYDRVLIVCEGAKTEPHYFEAVRDALELATANVIITGNCGSAPQSVVTEAQKRFKDDPDYDQIYCVFDRDGHTRYAQAMDTLSRWHPRRPGGANNKPVAVEAIISVPCFEYWLLLHFEYTTAHLANAEAVIARLKPHWHGRYHKGDASAFTATWSRHEQALTHARRALLDAASAGTDNPTTRVHELVEALKCLKTFQSS